MKKLFALMLAAALALSLAACGGGGAEDTNTSGAGNGDTTSTDTPSGGGEDDSAPTEEEPQEKVEYYKIGDTVSTDIIEFTLDEAELAIALSNTVDENYFLPKEYDPQRDAKNPLVAAKGHTYATFSYTICNLDRTNYNGKLPFVTAEYKDTTSNKQVDGAEYKGDTWITTGNNPTSPVYSWRFVLDVGIERSFRSFIDIPVEADDLTDGFLLNIELPISDGTTSIYTYKIG